MSNSVGNWAHGQTLAKEGAEIVLGLGEEAIKNYRFADILGRANVGLLGNT
jgi:hypothetical protein